MSIFARIAERRISEAVERGDLDDLPLKGQPIPREDLSGVPEELRMGYKILKNAGMLPEEMNLRKELLTLRDLLECCRCLEERARIKKRLTLMQLHYDILQERNRRNASFSAYEPRMLKKLGL